MRDREEHAESGGPGPLPPRQDGSASQREMAMAMAINSTARAVENMEYVRSLLKQRQPEFAAALERAAMLAEKTPQSHGDVSFSVK
jgi:hypothetical protein